MNSLSSINFVRLFLIQTISVDCWLLAVESVSCHDLAEDMLWALMFRHIKLAGTNSRF